MSNPSKHGWLNACVSALSRLILFPHPIISQGVYTPKITAGKLSLRSKQQRHAKPCQIEPHLTHVTTSTVIHRQYGSLN